MEPKRIDLNQSVYSLCQQHPELTEILAAIGFPDIAKPGMLATAGRFMTIPKGAAMKKLDLGDIVRQLAERGFSAQK